ncbi:MAG: glycosyltransferase family 39 protein, partial [Candidatus Omnitrophica bacterium]|nr:glycosyltransferase family 39 protein [Candidatus Omnitrophota bacterium]
PTQMGCLKSAKVELRRKADMAVTKDSQSTLFSLITNPRPYFCFVAGIIGIALVLRLVGLNRGIWFDEYRAVGIISIQTWLPPLEIFRFYDHPPLYFVLLKLWSHINSSEPFLRLLSVLCGMGTLIILMRWMKQYCRQAALIAGLCCATFPMMLRYSQEIRNYPLLLFATALSFFYATHLVAKPHRLLSYLKLLMSFILLVSTHAVGIMVLPSVFFYMYLNPSLRKNINPAYVAFLVTIPLLIFVVTFFVFMQNTIKQPDTWWIPPASLTFIGYQVKRLFGLWPLTHCVTDYFPAAKSFVLPFLALSGVFFSIFGDWKRSFPLFAAAFFYWLTLIVFSNLVLPIFLAMTALPGLIPFIGFLGVHISTIQIRKVKIAAVLILMLFCAVSVRGWVRSADLCYDRSKNIVHLLNVRHRPGDIIIFFPNTIRGLMGYYGKFSPESTITIGFREGVNSVDKKLNKTLEALAVRSGRQHIFWIARLHHKVEGGRVVKKVRGDRMRYLQKKCKKPIFAKQMGMFSLSEFKVRRKPRPDR